MQSVCLRHIARIVCLTRMPQSNRTYGSIRGHMETYFSHTYARCMAGVSAVAWAYIRHTIFFVPGPNVKVYNIYSQQKTKKFGIRQKMNLSIGKNTTHVKFDSMSQK